MSVTLYSKFREDLKISEMWKAFAKLAAEYQNIGDSTYVVYRPRPLKYIDLTITINDINDN